jgi:hypothetical protein
VTIRVGGEPREYSYSRSYDDGEGVVDVRRRNPCPEADDIGAAYRYEDRPLPEVWPTWNGIRFANEVTEMVVASRALAALRYRNARMAPRKPPRPDLYVECEEESPFAAEVTLNTDRDEAAFQRAREEFLRHLNNRAASGTVPFDVSLGFVAVPARREFDAVADALFAHVERSGSVGIHALPPELEQTFAQIRLGPRTGREPFSGGGVVNERGHADLRATTLDRISEKRDMMDYLTDGRPLWLIVGMSVPLIGPDVMGEMYDLDLALGRFSKIVLSEGSDLVTFTRRDPRSGGDRGNVLRFYSVERLLRIESSRRFAERFANPWRDRSVSFTNQRTAFRSRVAIL